MSSHPIISRAITAIHERTFFAQYPEHPKAYAEDGMKQGNDNFQACLNQPFKALLQTGEMSWIGEEVSPYTQKPLGVTYPAFGTDELIQKSSAAAQKWQQASPAERCEALVNCLEEVKTKFFDIAFATMHTTGQSFMMSFQASGPHSNDRALEAIAAAYEQLTSYPETVLWEKPMGKFSIKLEKNFIPVPKGIGLVIGCSTFPVWNTLPGLFANLSTGNPAIVKPHPKAVLPIAIVIAAMQQSLVAAGYSADLVQLAVDSSEKLITKELCENVAISLIDYTGGSSFGSYVESLKGKTVFTEKAGVNSVIMDSVNNLDDVLNNLAFSVSLYSGQMCTAPQNIFIPEKVLTAEGETTFEQVAEKFKASLQALINNPKAGPGTLGAIQNEATLQRALNASSQGEVSLSAAAVMNEEFPQARTCSPAIITCNASDKKVYEQELFGPIVILIKTKNTEESIALAQEMCKNHGAITCAAYTTNSDMEKVIATSMNKVFAPVSFNLTGFIWVNQHATFSDFHVTGGNPAGNATFTNSEFVSRRFVWVGNRKLIA